MKIISITPHNTDELSIAINENSEFISTKKEIVDALVCDQTLEGTYSFALMLDEGCAFLTRDNLGSRKLFYYRDVDNDILYISKNFIELTKRFNSNKVFSVPKGGYLLIESDRVRRIRHKRVSTTNSNFDIYKIEKVLVNFFKFLKLRLKKKPLIFLSGGLDSTIIARYATEEFGSVDVVTGVLCSSSKCTSFNNPHSDFSHAKKIAAELKANFYPVFIDNRDIIDELRDVLKVSQDWRDYNVHCATLNYFIAKNIKKLFNSKDYVVLTGDFMNEIFADYTEEYYKGQEFYRQPKFNQKIRQRFFMNGLDSSDREIGVFENLGFGCIQPYSFVANHYRNLTNEQLSQSNSKYLYNGKLLPEKLLENVLRSKVRAQVGDSSGGILSLFIDAGISAAKLEELFCEFFSLDKNFIHQFIEVGSYRSEEL